MQILETVVPYIKGTLNYLVEGATIAVPLVATGLALPLNCLAFQVNRLSHHVRTTRMGKEEEPVCMSVDNLFDIIESLRDIEGPSFSVVHPNKTVKREVRSSPEDEGLELTNGEQDDNGSGNNVCDLCDDPLVDLHEEEGDNYIPLTQVIEEGRRKSAVDTPESPASVDGSQKDAAG